MAFVHKTNDRATAVQNQLKFNPKYARKHSGKSSRFKRIIYNIGFSNLAHTA